MNSCHNSIPGRNVSTEAGLSLDIVEEQKEALSAWSMVLRGRAQRGQIP